MRKAGLFNRLLALVLCAVMLVGYVPSTAFTALADELNMDEVVGGVTGDIEVEVPGEETTENTGETGESLVPLGLHYVIEEETVVIIGYEGTAPSLVIPAEIEGFPVTRVETSAFADNQVLTSVMLPDSITEIGNWAFYACSNLTSVTMPDGACVTGNYLFGGCEKLPLTEYEGGKYVGSRTNPYAYLVDVTDKTLTQLEIHPDTQNIAGNAIWGFGEITELTIPDSVLTIAEYGIYGCVNVTSLTIGSALEYLDSNNFFGFDALETVTVSEENQHFCADDSGVLFNKEQTVLIKAPATLADGYQIPATVKEIGYQAFSRCTNLTSLTIPEGVHTIGEYAFDSCTALKTVSVPNSITSIGNYAFNFLENLTYNTYENVNYIGNTENPYLVLVGMVDRTAASVTIHEDTRFICADAFAESGLTSVTIPDAVICIGSYAFRYCQALTSVTLGASVEQLGENAFMSCSKLASITVSADNAHFSTDSAGVLFDFDKTLLIQAPLTISGSYVIPETVERIGVQAFFGCENLTAVTIPDSVEVIEEAAFFNCLNLTLYFSMLSGFEEYAAEWSIPYAYNDTLTALSVESLPNKLEYALNSKLHTSGLSLKAVLADGTEMILTEGFTVDPCDMSTEGVKTVTVHCCNLSASFDITVDASIIELPESDHPYANNMDETWTYNHPTEVIGLWITFTEDTRTEVGCDTITILDATGAQVGVYSGEELSGATIGVAGSSFTIRMQTDGSVTMYGFAVESISEITSEEDLPEVVPAGLEYGFTEGGTVMIFGYSGMETTLKIPSKINGRPITHIQNSAFSGNGTLTSVTLPDTLERIEDYAFNSCQSLSSVTFGSGLTYIGNYAFAHCPNLTQLALPESVEQLGEGVGYYSGEGLLQVYDNARYIGTAENPYKFLVGTADQMLTACQIHPDTKVISDRAFANCHWLESITIPEGVTRIGSYAFGWCNALQTVAIPDSVTALGSNAFQSCQSLTSVALGSGLTELGQNLFEFCGALRSVQVSQDNTAFCTDAAGVLLNKAQTELILMPCGYVGSYVIPGTVQIIRENAFSNCDGLNEITIPEGVTTIGDQAFYSCDSLYEVTIPASVTNLAPTAFIYCANLTAIRVDEENTTYCSDESGAVYSADGTTLICVPAGIRDSFTVPQGVTAIGNSAFQGCALSEVVLPAGLQTIGSYSFNYCRNLTSIEIPEGVTTIADRAFCDSQQLAQIVIPASVTSIGESAFAGCGSLVIYAPLNSYAHTYASEQGYDFVCTDTATELTVTSLPTKLIYPIGGKLKLDGLTLHAVFENGETATITAGYTVDECDMTTAGTKTVTVHCCGQSASFEITVDASLVEYPESEHPYANNMNETWSYLHPTEALGLKITFSEETFFEEYCDFFTIYDANGNTVGEYTADQLSGQTVSLVGNSFTVNLRTDGGSQWYGFAITRVEPITSEEDLPEVVPAGLHYGILDDYAVINGYDGAESVLKIPSKINDKPVRVINSWAFSHNQNLTSVILPDTVDVIHNGAFYYCQNLQSVTFGSSVTEISDEAFYQCSSLTSLTIPDSVRMIGYDAFAGCSGLTELTIGSGVQEFGSGVFRGCASLTSVTLPDTLETISSDMFAWCSSLTEVNLGSNIKTIGANAFNGCEQLQYNTYGNARYLGSKENPYFVLMQTLDQYIDQIEIHPDTVIIAGSALANCYNLTAITVPDSVKSIGDSAFAQCENLVSVTLGAEVTAIGSNAFANCPHLTELYIPASVTEIGTSAFYNCSSLTGIWVAEENAAYSSDESGVLYNKDKTRLINVPCKISGVFQIPETVQIIGSRAFEYCHNITSVVIPESVAAIEDNAFYACDSLTSVTVPASVTQIGMCAFEACGKLTGIWIAEENTVYSSDDSGVLFNKDKTELIQAPGNLAGVYEIPATVTQINPNAFAYCRQLTSVSIPASVISIGEQVFYYCEGLTAVELPGSVQTISWNMFYGCSNLTEVTVGSGTAYISAYAFAECEKLESVHIPDSVTMIDMLAFERSGNVTLYCSIDSYTAGFAAENNIPVVYTDTATELSIETLPTKLTYPLYGKLKTSGLSLNITLADGTVRTVSTGYTVDACDMTTAGTKTVTVYCCGQSATFQITVDASLVEYPESEHPYSKNIDETWKYVHPTDALGLKITFSADTYVADYNDYIMIYDGNGVCIAEYTGGSLAGQTVAVAGNSFEIRLLASQYGMMSYGFTVTGVEEITSAEELPESIPYGLYYETTDEGVWITSYQGRQSILRIPATIGGQDVVGLRSWMISNSYVTEVYVPETVTRLYSESFGSSGNLTAIWVDENNPNYSSDENGVVFNKDKTALITLPVGYNGDYTVPETVETIETSAFSYTSNLTSVTIPAGVSYIGGSVFYGCHGLTGIWVDAQNPNYCSDEHGVLYDKEMTRVMKAPAALSGSYEIPDGVTTVDYCAFQNCVGLTAVTVPDSVTYINESAFEGSSGLTLYGSVGGYAESYAAEHNIPYKYTVEVESISIATLPTRLTYAVGGKVKLDGMTLNVVLADGTQIVATTGFAMDDCDTSEAGVKTVTVRYAGLTVSFEITVDPDMVLYPESDHPYGHDMDQSWVYTHKTDAEALAITFSSNTRTEDIYDYIYIYDADGNEVGVYDGTTLAGKTITVPGNSFTIRMTSDGGMSYYGFEITNVEATTIPTASDALDALHALYPNGMEDNTQLTYAVTVGEVQFAVNWQINYGTEAVWFEDDRVTFHPQSEDVTYQIEAVIAGSNLSAVWTGIVEGRKPQYNEMGYPESYHPYADDEDMEWTYTYDGEEYGLQITFSEDTYTEQGYDYITITDHTGTTVGSYSGYELAGQTLTVPGNSFTVRLTADGSNTGYGFSITDIQPVEPPATEPYITELVIVQLPDKLVYPLNGVLDLDGLSLSLLYSDGTLQPITTGYKVENVDLTTAGTKTVTLTFNILSATFEITVDPDLVEYPESDHPYANGTNKTWKYTHNQPANYLKITFSEDTYTEGRYDWIYIYNGDGTQLGKYGGSNLSGKTVITTGNSFSIKLTSDSITTYYGFSITSIEALMEEEDLFLYTVEDGCATITDYYGKDSVLEIPSHRDGYPVTKIGSGVFQNNTTITELILPQGLKEIGGNAFYGCSNLEKITFSQGLTTIGSSAFLGCKKLKTLELPESVTSIGSSAFQSCDNLQQVTLPSQLTELKSLAFCGCVSLKQINLPESLTVLEYSVFTRCTALESITIPGNIKTIRYRAFENCTSLQEVILSDGVTAIDYEVFSGCTALQSIVIPDTVTDLSGRAFKNCTALSNVTLSKNWTKTYVHSSTYQDYSPFEGCTSLLEIDIPDTYTSIPRGAFSGCSWLTDIQIPSGVTLIEYAAFKNCASLTQILLPEGLTAIEPYAFSGCTGLTELVIPDTVTGIAGYAFKDCTNLTDVTLSAAWNTTYVNNQSAGRNYTPFYQCTNLTSITLPEGMVKVPDYAFRDCWSLEEVIFPESLETVGSSSFIYCSGLTKINFSTGLKSIQGYGFAHNNALETVELPEGLTSVGDAAFFHCNSLKNVTIPTTLTSITSSMFRECYALESFEIPEWVTSIGQYAFQDCTSLKSITIPNTVTSIGSYVFRNCTALTEAVLGAGVTSMPIYFFDGCSALTAVTIPVEITQIGRYAFNGCTALTDVYYSGAEDQWAAMTIDTYNDPLTAATVNYVHIHSYGDWFVVQDATCAADGQRQKVCADCGYVHTESIPALPHSYESTVVEPTYVTQGYTQHTCSACGHSYQDTFVDAYPRLDISMAEITLEYTSAYYKGEPVTPGVGLKYNGQYYVAETELRVTYLNNDRVGTATAIIEGINMFEGTVELEFTISYETYPDPIVNVVAIGEIGKVSLSWGRSNEVGTSTYRIYRQAAGESEFTLVGTVYGRDNLSWEDTHVEKEQTYSYYVTGVDVYGAEGEASEIATAVVQVDRTAPAVLKLTPASGSIIHGKAQLYAVVTDNVGVTKVSYFYSQDNGVTWYSIGQSTETGFGIVFDTVGLTGAVKVKAVAYDAENNESDPLVSVYSLDNEGPDQVTGLDAVTLSSKITLSWDDVKANDAAYFIVEVQEGEQWKLIANRVTTLGYTVTGLQAATEYTYRVACVDTHGNVGEYSEPITAATQSDTSAPVITDLSPGSGRYNSSIYFYATARDDCDVEKIEIQLSTDRSEWNTISETVFEEHSGRQTYGYTVDLTDLADGSIFLRAIATDFAGNVSDTSDSAPYTEYIVDRTAPNAPQGVTANGADGYITVSWTIGEEVDLGRYYVYRSDALDGEYTLIASYLSTSNYHDRNVQDGAEYYYKVMVSDGCGNMSQFSDAVSATMSPDTQMPAITGVTKTYNQCISSKNSTVQISASDNNKLSSVIVEYCTSINSEYAQIAAAEGLSSYYHTVSVELPIAELEDGTVIYLRAYAVDHAGLRSEYETVKYTVDNTAPAAEDFAAEILGNEVTLTWNDCGESDLAGFRVYRSTDGVSFTMLGSRGVNAAGSYSFVDTITAQASQTYTYKLEVLDVLGNTASWTDTVDYTYVYVNKAPVARMTVSDFMTVGVEELFDASGSSDDLHIDSYLWDFGDGTQSTEVQPVKSYEEVGTYTVTLTVTDNEGLTASYTKNVEVKERDTLGTLNVKVTDDNNKALAHVPVYFDLGSESQKIVYTNSYGVATLKLPSGSHTIGMYAQGYLPVKKNAVVLANAIRTVSLTTVEQEIVTGNFEVTRMTFDEIVAAGIDIYDPANQNVYSATVRVTYGASMPLNIRYIRNDTSILGYDIVDDEGNPKNKYEDDNGEEREITGITYIPIGGGGGGGESGSDIVAIIDIPASASYLKEFFDVRLHIINNASSDFVLENNEVVLNVPAGMSLMTSVSGGYYTSNTVSFNTLRGQQNITLSWVLRGDEAGEYELSADYTGILAEFDEIVSARFETDDPIKVYGLEGVKFRILACDEIYNDTLYFNVEFENQRDIDIYMPAIGLTERVYNVTESVLNNNPEGDFTAECYILNAYIQSENGEKLYVPITYDANGKATTGISTLAPGQKIVYEYVAYNAIDYNGVAVFRDAAITEFEGLIENIEVGSMEKRRYSFVDYSEKLDNILVSPDQEHSNAFNHIMYHDYYYVNEAENSSTILESLYKLADLVLSADTSVLTQDEQRDVIRQFILTLLSNSSMAEQADDLVNVRYYEIVKDIIGFVETGVLNDYIDDGLSAENISSAFADIVKDSKELAILYREKGEEAFYQELSNKIGQSALGLTIDASLYITLEAEAKIVSDAWGMAQDVTKAILNAAQETEKEAYYYAMLKLRCNSEISRTILDAIIEVTSAQLDSDLREAVLWGMISPAALVSKLTEAGLGDSTLVLQIAVEMRDQLNKNMDKFYESINLAVNMVEEFGELAAQAAIKAAMKAALGSTPLALVTAVFGILDAIFGWDSYYKQIDTLQIYTTLSGIFETTFWDSAAERSEDADMTTMVYLMAITELRTKGEAQFKSFMDDYMLGRYGKPVSEEKILSRVGSSHSTLDAWYDDVVYQIVRSRDILFNVEGLSQIDIPRAPVVTLDYSRLQTVQTFTSEYEYCFADGVWKSCENAPISFTTGVVPSVLRVRKAAGVDSLAGQITTVRIFAQKELSKLITVKFDGVNYWIDNLSAERQYQIVFTNEEGTEVDWSKAKTISGSDEAVKVSGIAGCTYMVIRSCLNTELMETVSIPLQRTVSHKLPLDIQIEGSGTVYQTDRTGTYYIGDNVDLVATPHEGSEFVGWYIDNVCVSTDTCYIVEMAEDLTVRAVFTGTSIQKIKVTRMPRKVSYAIGENLDTNGMEVTVTYEDGSTIQTDQYTAQMTSNLAGDTSVMVCYGGMTDTYAINIAGCEHMFGIWHEQTAPTCTETGLEIRYCSICDEQETQTIDALGHIEVIDEAVDPTCTETGLTEGKHCDRCGETLAAQEEIPALGHDEVIDAAVAATCTETGLTEGKHCDRCDEVLIAQEEVPALGHNEVIDEAVDPTCTETGLTEGKHCDRCGEVLVAQTELPMLEHAYGDWVVVKNPTFTASGRREKSCTVCGKAVAETLLPATGKVERWNVSLLDNLQVNFHLLISEEVKNTAKVQVIVGDWVQTYRVTDLEKTEDGLYQVSVNIAAAQMNDDIVLVILSGHSMGDVVSYSVQQYAETVLADESLSQYHAMVKEMLNYGAAAQTHFDYNADNLVNDGITGVGAAEIPEKAEQEIRIDGAADGITHYANSLVYADRVAVRFYYKVTGNIADYSFKVGDTVYQPVQKGEYYYVEVPGITPENLDKQIEMTVTDADGNELTVAYSPMNYIVRMNAKGSDSLKALLKALYNYHLAAKALKAAA